MAKIVFLGVIFNSKGLKTWPFEEIEFKSNQECMPNLKDVTIEVLKNISPSASLEEIMYKINLAALVMEGH